MEPTEDEILTRFVAARSREDRETMRNAWNALLERRAHWVSEQVARLAYGRLEHDEPAEATALAFHNLAVNMIWTFAGTSVGEWVNSAKRLIQFACMNIQADARRRRERRPSFDASTRHDTGEPAGEVATAIARVSRDTLLLDADHAAEEDLHLVGAAFLAWATPQLTDRRRRYLELELQGRTVPEIQEILGCSRDVVHSTKRHTRRDLRRLREAYER